MTLAAAIALACQGAGCRQPFPPEAADEHPCPIASPGFPPVIVHETGVDDPIETPRKHAWEAAHGGQAAAKPFIHARLAGWPTALLADRSTLPGTDRAFLERLARDTWRGLDALRDRHNGLPLDHVRFGAPSSAPADAFIGDYTGPSTTGLYLAATVAAADLGLLPRAEAVARISGILDTLGRLETHAGFFFAFYDTTSEERTSHFISFVDSAWLTAGLLVTRQAFPEVAAAASRIVDAQDYGFFYDADYGQMTHGYFAHRGQRSRYHYGMLYTESRLGSLLAIGHGDVPTAHWFRMIRTFPPACAWQQREPIHRHRKDIRGHTFWGGYYVWDGTPYVPSWGGSMFEALMPALFLDEARHAPASLGANDATHAALQQRYATQTLGRDVWGLSPSYDPRTGVYGEFGVPPLGAAGYQAGPVAPHATALALPFVPGAATTALRRLVDRYDVYGEYGYYDAVDPSSGAVAYTYLGIDQSMTLLATANVLAAGSVQRHFEADPIVQRVLPWLALERFFE